MLLQNCAKRLAITVASRRDVDIIISTLSGNNASLPPGKQGLNATMDAVYEKYIPKNLQDYIIKNYPQWSIPERYRWHPNLFDKYRAERSAAPIISDDFNCDGKKDYAVLMDKQKKGLAVMLFLANEQSFTSQVLTENLVHDVPKIEYVLSVVKPGLYKTIDPDMEGPSQSVRLLCAGIGIGLFKELYDGGKDVYYIANGELRSCLIEN